MVVVWGRVEVVVAAALARLLRLPQLVGGGAGFGRAGGRGVWGQRRRRGQGQRHRFVKLEIDLGARWWGV